MILSTLLPLLILFSISAGSAIRFKGVKKPTSTPAIGKDFADPSIIQVDNKWFAFASSGNGVHVQMAASRNFEQWSTIYGVDALSHLPSWVKIDQPDVWAPDVVQTVCTLVPITSLLPYEVD
jgi:beta-xylosidase